MPNLVQSTSSLVQKMYKKSLAKNLVRPLSIFRIMAGLVSVFLGPVLVIEKKSTHFVRVKFVKSWPKPTKNSSKLTKLRKSAKVF